MGELIAYLGEYTLQFFLDQISWNLLQEHENAYVRASAAAAIGESVEQWPQTVEATVSVLQDYYREKVLIPVALLLGLAEVNVFST